MKNGRFSDAQIMGILKQAESGVPVSELCREHGMSSASFYKWRAKLCCMTANVICGGKARQLKQRERIKQKTFEARRLQHSKIAA